MKFSLITALTFCLLPAVSAQADLVYDVILDANSANLASGAVVPVNIVLTESGVNDAEQAHTLVGGSGLLGYDIVINAAGGDATMSNVQFPGYSPAFGNAANVNITPTSLKLFVTSDSLFTSPFQGQNVSSVTIGTFDLTYNSTDTTVSAISGSSGFPFSLGAGFSTTAIPDSNAAFSSRSFTGTAVPEPSSFTILFLPLCGLIARRRKR